MFGIGGGEIIFILFIILMLFGSDKVPEIARTMGKAMAQLKNATNDIKSEIQKGVESNGFDTKSLSSFKESFTTEIDQTKEAIVGNSSTITTEIDEASNSILQETTTQINEFADQIEDGLGAIKRKK